MGDVASFDAAGFKLRLASMLSLGVRPRDIIISVAPGSVAVTYTVVFQSEADAAEAADTLSGASAAEPSGR